MPQQPIILFFIEKHFFFGGGDNFFYGHCKGEPYRLIGWRDRSDIHPVTFIKGLDLCHLNYMYMFTFKQNICPNCCILVLFLLHFLQFLLRIYFFTF